TATDWWPSWVCETASDPSSLVRCRIRCFANTWLSPLPFVWSTVAVSVPSWLEPSSCSIVCSTRELLSPLTFTWVIEQLSDTPGSSLRSRQCATFVPSVAFWTIVQECGSGSSDGLHSNSFHARLVPSWTTTRACVQRQLPPGQCGPA